MAPCNRHVEQTLHEAEVRDVAAPVLAGHRGAYDLVIVGGGSAAFAAAIRGTNLGARVAIVERGTIGGPA